MDDDDAGDDDAFAHAPAQLAAGPAEPPKRLPDVLEDNLNRESSSCVRTPIAPAIADRAEYVAVVLCGMLGGKRAIEAGHHWAGPEKVSRPPESPIGFIFARQAITNLVPSFLP